MILCERQLVCVAPVVVKRKRRKSPRESCCNRSPVRKGRSLWIRRSESEGVGADLLSQLGSDAFAMIMGKLFPAESREAGALSALKEGI